MAERRYGLSIMKVLGSAPNTSKHLKDKVSFAGNPSALLLDMASKSPNHQFNHTRPPEYAAITANINVGNSSATLPTYKDDTKSSACDLLQTKADRDRDHFFCASHNRLPARSLLAGLYTIWQETITSTTSVQVCCCSLPQIPSFIAPLKVALNDREAFRESQLIRDQIAAAAKQR